MRYIANMGMRKHTLKQGGNTDPQHNGKGGV